MQQIDDIDRALIDLLGQDARQPVAGLAKRLGLARSTVQARLDRLEARGVIAGYAVRLGADVAEGAIRATVLLTLEPRAATAVLGRLRGIEPVRAVHTASGRFDMVLEMRARSTRDLDEALDRIGEIEGVRATESLIHLSTRFDRGR